MGRGVRPLRRALPIPLRLVGARRGWGPRGGPRVPPALPALALVSEAYDTGRGGGLHRGRGHRLPKASEFFALARSGARTAAKGPKPLLSSMIGYACRGPSGPEERGELAALLHRTASACAACGTTLPDSFQNAEWLKIAGSSFALMSPSGSEGIEACPRCRGTEFLFLHPSPHP